MSKPRRAPRTCTVCGCTDARACHGPIPCSWVIKRPAICSGCFTFFMNVRDPAKLGRVLEALGVSGTWEPEPTHGPSSAGTPGKRRRGGPPPA
jgi:hypothetical protein